MDGIPTPGLECISDSSGVAFETRDNEQNDEEVLAVRNS